MLSWKENMSRRTLSIVEINAQRAPDICLSVQYQCPISRHKSWVLSVGRMDLLGWRTWSRGVIILSTILRLISEAKHKVHTQPRSCIKDTNGKIFRRLQRVTPINRLIAYELRMSRRVFITRPSLPLILRTKNKIVG